MIFGKTKKDIEIEGEDRPLESAAINRWRNLDSKISNEPHKIETKEDNNIQVISLNEVFEEDEATTFIRLEDDRDGDRDDEYHSSNYLEHELENENNELVEYEDEIENEGEEEGENEDLGDYSEPFKTTNSLFNYQAQTHEEGLEEYEEEVEETLQETIHASVEVVETKPIKKVPSTPPLDKANFRVSSEQDLKNRFGDNIQSALGAGTMIEGRFSFEAPVRIDGSLKGEIKSSSALIVGENAVVNANIKVGALIILGSVEGEIEANDLIEIRSGGTLLGDIVTKRIALEEGGVFSGRCTMLD